MDFFLNLRRTLPDEGVRGACDEGINLIERLLANEDDWGDASLSIVVSSSCWIGRSFPDETEETLFKKGTGIGAPFFLGDILCLERDCRNNIKDMNPRR